MATQTVSNATVTTPAPVPAVAPAPLTPEQIAAQAALAARDALIKGVVQNATDHADDIRAAELVAIDATSTRGFNESLAVAKLYNLPLAFLRNWRPARSNSKDACPEEIAIRQIHNTLRPSDGPTRVSEIMEVLRSAVSSVPAAATEGARTVSQVIPKPNLGGEKKGGYKDAADAQGEFAKALERLENDDERDAWSAAMDTALTGGDFAPLNKLLSDAGAFVSKAKTTSRRWRAALILPYVAGDIRDAGDIGANWQPASEKALKALQDLVSKRLDDVKLPPEEEECRDAMRGAVRDYLGLSDNAEPIDPEAVKAKRLANAVSVIFNKLKYLSDNGGLSADGRTAIEAKCKEYGLVPSAKGNGAASEEETDATDPAAAAIAAQENAAAQVETAPATTTDDATAAAQVVAATNGNGASDGPVTSAPVADPNDAIAKARAALAQSGAAVPTKAKVATKASKLARK